MSGNLTPYSPSPAGGLTSPEAYGVDHWGPAAPPAAPPTSGSPQFLRYASALNRYKWLMLFVIAIGTAFGLVATRFIQPQYAVYSRIWINSETPIGNGRDGPIVGRELVVSSAWAELLRSFRVSDAVVSQMALYLTPRDEADSAVFDGFSVTPQLRPGEYELEVDGAGRNYELRVGGGDVVERGLVGNPVGRRVGFVWQPSRETLGRNRTVKFSVVTPREAAVRLVSQLEANIPKNTNFLVLTLRGEQPHRTAATLNAWTDEFVNAAGELKRRQLTEFANMLEGQLTYAQRSLQESEVALQQFKVNTITLPNENTVVTPGVDQTTGFVVQDYFKQKVEYDNLRRDRETLQRFVTAARRGTMSADAVMSIPSVQSAGAQNFRSAVEELWKVEAQLRTARQFYTDDYKTVKELEQQATMLRTKLIPQTAEQLLAQLRVRENDLASRIRAASGELQGIPQRTIEETRLTRQVSQAENLFRTLKNRYEDAKLAEESAMPDISVLDSAVAPLRPTNNTAPRIVLMALGASVGLAVLLALLLDQLDRRFRYPDQVSRELGLDIIGAVPALRRTRNGAMKPEEASQVVESFRSIRLNLRHAFPGRGPVIFTVSSPGAGDGKSLVASNLAMSFAEAGYRTLLVDGDIRRGTLHTAFDVEQRPGLLDVLAGEVPRSEVFKPSAYENLTVLPCGTRRRRGPELLTSPAMTTLLNDARSSYDAIVVDSAPLGAGVDAYALGAATGNMVLVFRTGATDRKLAQAKLSVLDRLPVRLIGAVLNSVETSGAAYQYYSYLYGYEAGDEEQPQLTSQVGQISGRT
jgi:polysaccharide biosynthesis transport protein